MRSHRRGLWIGIIAALIVGAGLLWAQAVDPPKGAPTSPPDQKVSYPIPVPNVVVTGRVLTDVGMTPVAGAHVRLEPVGGNPPGPIVIYADAGQAGPPPPNVRQGQPGPGRMDGKGRAGQPQPGLPGQAGPPATNVQPGQPQPGQPQPGRPGQTGPQPQPSPDKDAQGRVIAPIPPLPYPVLKAVTDGQGNFKIAAFPGKYVVRIEAQGFEAEYYDNATDKKGAKEIELEYGMDPVELAIIRLKSISTIAGKVAEAGTGKAVTLGLVVARPERVGVKRSASLSADGAYLIEGLAEGRYTVQVTARGYLPAIYTRPGPGTDLNIVTVRQNTSVTGIDFSSLSRGLSFSGKAEAAEGGPLAGVTVTAVRINAKEGLEQTAETATDGSYTLSGLLPGDYIVHARKPGYGLQVYDKVKDRKDARPVSVAEGRQPQADVNFALSKVGTILGAVKAADGKPIEGAAVAAHGVAGFGSRGAKTDANGQYIITDLPTADFLVTAQAKGFALTFYQNTTDKGKAKQVRVLSDAHTAGIDFTLPRMATVSGSVAGPDGPIEGARVLLLHRIQVKPPQPEPGRPLPQPEPGQPSPTLPPFPQPGLVKMVKTDAKGAFKFENVEAGTYIVQANARGFIGEFYDDVGSADAATPVEVAASQNVLNVNLKLTALAVISGTVKAADGKALEQIEVVAVRASQPGDGSVPPPVPRPLSAGQEGGPPPPTREGVAASPGPGGPQPPGGPSASSPAQSGPQPQPPQQAGGPAEQKGGIIAQPPGVPGGPAASPIPPDGLVTRFRAEVDAKTGTYKIVGLPEGEYKVRAAAKDYIPKFNGDAESADKAAPISVKDGSKTENVNFVLAKGGAVSGFVLGDGDGRPVQGGIVTAQRLGGGGSSDRVEANGAFRVGGLADGSYLLKAGAPGYIGEFYDDTRQPDKAKIIEIRGGNEVAFLIIGLARRSPIDFNGDGVVDLGDLFMFAQGFGQRKGGPQYNEGMDLNHDGKIDFDDFFAFVAEFNKGKGKAGKPVVGADAGAVSFTDVGAPSGLVAVRMTLEASDMAGYAATLGYDRDNLTFVRAERQGGGAPTASSTPGEVLLTDRAGGPTAVTLYFRALGDVRGDVVTPKMVALLGADGVLRPLDLSAVVKTDATPKAFSLAQNVPNPFNPATQIAFDVPADGPVNLSVYNLLGQRVRTLVDERRTAGRYVVTWDGRDEVGRPAATGLYLYRLTAPGFAQTRKMTLLR